MEKLLLLATAMLMLATSVNSSTQNDLFQRYSQMKLLTSCLGEATMARYRQQMEAATRQCQGEPAFIAALLHLHIPTVLRHQNQFVPSIPHLQQQESLPVSSPQYTANANVPFYVTSPLTRYYHISPHNVVPLAYPQPSPQVFQNFKPQPSHQFAQTSNVRNPVVPPHQVNLQQSDPQYVITSSHPARQLDTYTDPSLKYEETEKYQLEQKLQRNEAFTRATSDTKPTSAHQQTPFRPSGQGVATRQHNRQAREAEPGFAMRFEGPSSKFPPQEQSLQQHQERLRSSLRSRVSDKVSNLTCVMKAMGLLDDNLDPNYDFLERSLLELPVSNAFHRELVDGHNYCREAAKCLPRRSEPHQLPITRQFSSSLEYFRCFGKEKLRACLKADLEAMSQMLGTERGPLTPTEFVQSHTSELSAAVANLDELLNGGSEPFIDLVLL